MNIEHIIRARELNEKNNIINNLLATTINQEYKNLEERLDILREKLDFLEKTFEKRDVEELTKCWSEILLKTNNYIDFVLESYRDISI